MVFPALGTSEDAAMLLADSKGARLLVAVGTHASLVEFLDKGRAGMASTFLTRLRVGPKLVDAKGVSRIYRSQIKTWHLVLLVLSGLLALVTALLFTDVGWAMGSLIVARIRDLLYWVKGSSRESCGGASTGHCDDQLPLPHRLVDGGVHRLVRRHRGRGLARPVGGPGPASARPSRTASR